MTKLKRISRTSVGRNYYAKSRVYGAIDALAPECVALEPEWVHEVKGEVADPVTRVKGKIWRAWRDGTKAIAAERLSALIAKAIEDKVEGFEHLTSAKVTFSYKAGCSCGCSPGFILDGTVREDGWNVDIHVITAEGR